MAWLNSASLEGLTSASCQTRLVFLFFKFQHIQYLIFSLFLTLFVVRTDFHTSITNFLTSCIVFSLSFNRTFATTKNQISLYIQAAPVHRRHVHVWHTGFLESQHKRFFSSSFQCSVATQLQRQFFSQLDSNRNTATDDV